MIYDKLISHEKSIISPKSIISDIDMNFYSMNSFLFSSYYKKYPKYSFSIKSERELMYCLDCIKFGKLDQQENFETLFKAKINRN